MVLPLRDGLLPTPISSKINSKDSTSCISPSTYPLPYEAVQIINSFNISEQPKWNISVGTKNIKLKMEWLTINTHMDKTTSFNFPATVLHSISLFNLDKPTWSSSFNGQEVLLNCDWKIINNNSTPLQFNTPSQSAATLYNSPDSGYHTGSPPTTHTPSTVKSYVYSPPNLTTPTKLFHNPAAFSLNPLTPPYTPYHKGTFPHNRKNTSSAQTKPKDKPKHSTIHVLDSSNKKTPSHTHKIPISSPQTSPSTTIHPPSSKRNTTATCNKIFNKLQSSSTNTPPVTTMTTSSPTTNPSSHPSKSSTSLRTTSTAKEDTAVNMPSCSLVTEKENDITIIPSSPLICISDKSSQHNIITHVNDSPPDFDLADGSYLPTPSPLITTQDGLLDDNIQAEQMDIEGSCRLCKKKVNTQDLYMHLLYCPPASAKLDTICAKYAKLSRFHRSENDIFCVINDYLERAIDDETLSDYFSLPVFKMLLEDIELFLDEQARTIFKKNNIRGKHKRFNVIKFK